MNSDKPSTPATSPKIPKAVKMDAPSTPPSVSRGKQKRLSSTFLKTPEQNVDNVPFSPSVKRTSSGSYKSPDYKLNSNNIASPYSHNLLKTPRNSGYDSDDNSTEGTRLKLQKTPQYFSPGKKLFSDDSTNKEELSEISSQLKSKLSSALGKIQSKEKPGKFNFTELNFDSHLSPTKKTKSQTASNNWSTSTSLQQTNLNLQTLQQSPLPNSGSPTFSQSSQFAHTNTQSPLKQSPILTRNGAPDRPISMPSPDEESSAHNALIAALSRQRKSRSLSNSGKQRPIFSAKGVTQFIPPGSEASDLGLSLPPLSVALSGDSKPKGEDSSNNEQDAVLSLMSLSSPQSIKFAHSRTHSQNNNSPESSRSSSVMLGSPTATNARVLPSVSGVLTSKDVKPEGSDNDETDVDNDVTDDDMDDS